MRLEKKKVKWKSDVEEFTTQAAWGGAQRDMAVVRAKLGCKHDVFRVLQPAPSRQDGSQAWDEGWGLLGSDSASQRRIHMGLQQEVL